MVKVRLSSLTSFSHCLKIEVGRHHNVAPEDRLCKLRGEEKIKAVEDEYHDIFFTAFYMNIYSLYL